MDKADRGVFLHLPPIAPGNRCAEEDLWAVFTRDYPRIFSGVLDAVVGGLRERPSIRLEESPRMFDFARFGEAMRRIAPQIRMHGLSINFVKTRESRLITLTATRAPIVPSPSHVTPSPIKSSSDQ